MAVKIQLTPQELLSQSQEMKGLQAEYETLFGQSQTLLGQVNANWSANLANNFAGKILSAQKSFKQITSMLEAGGNLAQESARTMESVDSLLAKNMAAGDGIGGLLNHGMPPGGISFSDGYGVTWGPGSGNGTQENPAGNGSWLSEQWELLKEQWEHTGNFLEWANGNFEKLPKEIRKKIVGLLGKRTTSAVSMTYDIITGNAGWGTANTFVRYVVENSKDATMICNSLQMFFGKDYQDWGAHWGVRFEEYFKEGDLLAGVVNAGGALMTNFALGITDTIVDTGLDLVSRLPVVGMVTDACGITKENWDKLVTYMGNDMKETYDQVAQAVARGEEFVQEKVSQVVDAAKETVSNVYENVKETASDVMDTIKDVNRGVARAAQEAGENIGKAAGKALDSVKEAVCFWKW